MTPEPPLLPLNVKEFESTLWFKRNWKWLTPIAACVIVGSALGFMAGIAALMKHSEAYQVALERARSSPAVVAQLGEPIREGWLVQGNINLQNDNGAADISFPIKGPRANATVYVVARKSAGRWYFRRISVEGDNGFSVDLSDRDDAAGP